MNKDFRTFLIVVSLLLGVPLVFALAMDHKPVVTEID